MPSCAPPPTVTGAWPAPVGAKPSPTKAGRGLAFRAAGGPAKAATHSTVLYRACAAVGHRQG
eukprot:2012347-Ditylum_brightwellii.AAC.1